MAAGAVAIALLVPGVVLMLTLHVLIICWALRQAAGARDFVAEGPAEVDSAGLSADELDKLPCYDFRAGGASGNRAVCLEAFRAGERCRLLPRCEHSFHAPCVDAWLCPICRAEAVGPRPKAAVVAMGVPEGRSPATLEIVAER